MPCEFRATLQFRFELPQDQLHDLQQPGDFVQVSVCDCEARVTASAGAVEWRDVLGKFLHLRHEVHQ